MAKGKIFKKKPSKLHKKWIRFGYKHTLLAILVVILTVILLDTAVIAAILKWFQNVKYLGAFIGGMMLVSSFLAAPAVVLLLAVADNVPTYQLVLVAAFGSVLGDWLILKFLQDEIAVEMRPLARRLNMRRRLAKLKKSRMRYVVIAIGAFIVMMPAPDELGLSLMGIGHLKRYKILIICFFLNCIGIFSLITLSKTII